MHKFERVYEVFHLILMIVIKLFYKMAEIDKATFGPVISIDYTAQKGLELNWNTKGMLISNQNVTIKHIIILCSTQYENVVNFLITYYSKMRLGDLLGIVKPSKKSPIGYKIIWIEKSNNTKIEQYMKEKYLIEDDVVKVIQKLCKAFEVNKELILMTIFPCYKKQKITEFVRGLRYEKVDNIIFYLCHKNYEYIHHANMTDGVFAWHYSDQKEVQRMCNAIKKYTNLIALSRISIRIESLNGQMTSQNNGNWYNADFPVIEKQYYGLFSTQQQEYIFFLSRDILYNFTLDLNIYLSYRLISGKEITCEKKIVLRNNNTKMYQRTFCMEDQADKEFYLSKDLVIKSNFARKEAIIWVSDVKEDLDRSGK